MSSREHIIPYLENRLAACRVWPELHAHQIAAYEQLLDLARGAPADYYREMTARGLTMAVVRAEWLDRYGGVACVHAALGDEMQRLAAAARFHAGRRPGFLAANTAVELPSAAWIEEASTSGDVPSNMDWSPPATSSGEESSTHFCALM